MTREGLLRACERGTAKNVSVDRAAGTVEAFFPKRLAYIHHGKKVYYGGCTVRLLDVPDDWLDRFERYG